MANTLDPKTSAVRSSDQNPDREATHVNRLLGLLTHNPDSLENILIGSDGSPAVATDDGTVDSATVAGVATGADSVAVTMDDASDNTGDGVDAEFTLDFVADDQGAHTFTPSGLSNGGRDGSSIVIATSAADSNTGVGTGAVLRITLTHTGATRRYTVEVIEPGEDFEIGDVLVFLGTSLVGASPAHDLTITVASLNTRYEVTVDEVGSGFASGDEITFPGTLFGGTSPTNDAVVTVASTLSTGGANLDAKGLLLQKLVNLKAALAAVDPDWEAQWTAAGQDLSLAPYDDISEGVVEIMDLIADSDFGPDFNKTLVSNPEDTENTN